MFRTFIASLCLVTLSACPTLWGDSPATGPSGAVRPAASDIPAGKLGFPLGTYLSVSGSRPGDGVKVGNLEVDTVNGKKLEVPVVLDVVGIARIPAGRCQINGYETGAMIGVPHEVARIEKIPLPQAGWQFHRTFVATSVVAPSDLRLDPDRHLPVAGPGLDLSAEERDAISNSALKAVRFLLRIEPNRKGDDIPKELWGEAIERLKPVRVVNDKANVKIVLAESAESESGLYVTTLISSYHPVEKDFAELVRIPDIRDGERSVIRPLYRYRLNKKP